MPAKKTGTSSKTTAAAKAGVAWGGIGDDAVLKATGKSWGQWLSLLDKRGAAKLAHPQIAEMVHELGAGDWWSQMVTVGYEQARGLRVKHQTASGFSASVSRTLPVSMAAVFSAICDDKKRKKWLPNELEITTATPHKSVRIAWPDGSRVAVGIYDKTGKSGQAKTQVAFQHEKLKNAAAVKKAKTFWAAKCDEMETVLTR